MTNTYKALGFWAWFSVHAQIPEETSIEDTLLFKGINSKIESINKELVWEIGPSKSGNWQLVISPNGNLDRLDFCKDIINLSPKIKGWDFYPAKPKKKWNRVVEIIDDKGNTLVDCSEWRYFLTAFDNNSFFDITFVVPPDIFGLAEKLLEVAGILVESELGEELMMNIVDRVEVCNEDDFRIKNELTNVKYLYSHLLNILRQPFT